MPLSAVLDRNGLVVYETLSSQSSDHLLIMSIKMSLECFPMFSSLLHHLLRLMLPSNHLFLRLSFQDHSSGRDDIQLLRKLIGSMPRFKY